MLNRFCDYSKLSFRLFFRNKIINIIVLIILLIVSVASITIMNIYFSYVDIGEKTIEDAYNTNEKIMEFRVKEYYFLDEDINVLSNTAKETGYTQKMCSNFGRYVKDEYVDVCYFNEYINDYDITEGKALEDNSSSTQYVWIGKSLQNTYSINDTVSIVINDGKAKDFIVAGYYAGDEILLHSDYLVSNTVYFYDDFDNTKTFSEISKIHKKITGKKLIKALHIDKKANARGCEVKEIISVFGILTSTIIDYFNLIKAAVLVVSIILLAVILSISAGIVKNYYNIHKEKNFTTLRMYSALGIKDSAIGYMFIMPLFVFSLALSIIAYGISALLCLAIQPTILQFIFGCSSNVLVPSMPLYMMRVAPLFINCIVMLLFVTVSFIFNFKTILSKKKSFLSEVLA